MVSSVRRSHFEEVGESEREWQMAVFRRKGTRGRKVRRRPVVEVSMTYHKGG